LRELLANKFPLLRGNELEFYIVNCDVTPPFSVKWKVRNCGEYAIKNNCIRGEISDDDGSHKRVEFSNFHGSHFVECYIVKDHVCVARDRIDVPIKI
jgi:Adenylyl/Guanylyl and SMODS C-terminal sensor domain